MKIYKSFTAENMIDHSPKWPWISHHPCRILMGGFWSGKPNAII